LESEKAKVTDQSKTELPLAKRVISFGLVQQMLLKIGKVCNFYKFKKIQNTCLQTPGTTTYVGWFVRPMSSTEPSLG
jgi:hypothetical protein